MNTNSNNSNTKSINSIKSKESNFLKFLVKDFCQYKNCLNNFYYDPLLHKGIDKYFCINHQSILKNELITINNKSIKINYSIFESTNLTNNMVHSVIYDEFLKKDF